MTILGSILPNGRSQFFSDGGVPLAGGSVATYQPATLVPASTWQDPALTILNVNPTPLDAAGSALLWASGEFRMIVKDSTGATVFDGLSYAAPVAAGGAGFGQQTGLASAATCDLGAIGSHNVLITGVTAISAFGNSAALSAPLYFCTVQNALQINYSANISIPTGANYTFAAGDSFLAAFQGAGVWNIVAIWPLTGTLTPQFNRVGLGKAADGTILLDMTGSYGSAQTYLRMRNSNAGDFGCMISASSASQAAGVHQARLRMGAKDGDAAGGGWLAIDLCNAAGTIHNFIELQDGSDNPATKQFLKLGAVGIIGLTFDSTANATFTSGKTLTIDGVSIHTNASTGVTTDQPTANSVITFTATSGGIGVFAELAVANIGTWNAAQTCLFLGNNSVTGRSLNASGTLNASGADVAEAKFKAEGCGPIERGQPCGLDDEGKITDRFSRLRNPRLKSGARGIEPAFVMGDSWGREDSLCVLDGAPLGARPREPQWLHEEPEPAKPFALPLPEAPILSAEPTLADADALVSHKEAIVVWDRQKAQHEVDSAELTARRDDWQEQRNEFITAHKAWEAANAAWEPRFAANVAAIDRLCYCGTAWVETAYLKEKSSWPKAGDYIVLRASPADSILWEPISPEKMLFSDLHYSIGRAERVADDGAVLVAR